MLAFTSMTPHKSNNSHVFQRNILILLIYLLISFTIVSAAPTTGDARAGLKTNEDRLGVDHGKSSFPWEEVEKGMRIARYQLRDDKSLLKPEAILLRYDPKYFSFHVQLAEKLSLSLADVKTVTTISGALAGINGSFFDPQGAPIGLLIVDGITKRNIHRGGSLLTGIFLIEDDRPKIIHRDEDLGVDVTQALQSGPRLIVNGKPVKVTPLQTPTRRSGVALTRDGGVILYATTLRFPGASLEQIQGMLLHPGLGVKDALNFDGGGSSQLYLAKIGARPEILISGGDNVPAFLLVKRRVVKE